MQEGSIIHRKFLSKIRLKNTFIAVVILFQLLLIVLSFTFLQSTIPLLTQAEDQRMRGVVTYVNHEIEQSTNRALIAISGVADNLHIAQVLAEQNREKLISETKTIWENLKKLGFAQFNFHIKQAGEVVFLYRAHNPEKFNDTVGFRPTVVKANSSKTIIKGLEQGRAGYGFRAVAPIFLDGTHIGSAEVGFDLSNAFLEILNANYPGSWALYNLDRGMVEGEDHVLLNAIGPLKNSAFKNLLPNKSILSHINSGNYIYELDESSETSSLYIPVKNFQGDIVLMVQYISQTTYFDQLQHTRIGGVIVCGIGLIVSSLILLSLYRMITTPIRSLVLETENIKKFNLDEPIKIASSVREVQDLVEAMEAMKIGLQSFRKYIPDQLVRQLISSRQEAVVSGQRRHMTILFTDIENFSTISEKLTPNELASQLSGYMHAMTMIITNHGGTVDKYIGDSIMAFWGAPLEMKDHALNACLAALACKKREHELASEWLAQNRPFFNTRIGISTGEVVVGNIGSHTRLSYTVIGDTVNLASRLEGLNKEYNTSVIISQPTLEELPDEFTYRLLDIVVVKGKIEPVPIYELAARKGDITSIDAEFMTIFSKAVESYVVKDWTKARNRFQRLLTIKPHDRACQIFIDRCNEYEINPPADDWGGEYVYHRK
ncbi:MAG: hypothetical protein H7835_13480 [Magnetococcus sp. XQGC-1]